MDARIREQVQARAEGCCEYCRLPQEATPLVPHHVEHIVARQHGGADSEDNLALACDRCNAYKGPNLTGLLDSSGLTVNLCHPRKHSWDEHFELKQGVIVGKTDIGKVTVQLLQMNAPRRVQLRLVVS